MESVECREKISFFTNYEKGSVDVSSEENQIEGTSLICMKCREFKYAHYKLLPCLHLCCTTCLENLIKDNVIAMPKTEVELKCSIFSCSQCNYIIRVVNEDASFLKSIILKSSKNGFTQPINKLKSSSSTSSNFNNEINAESCNINNNSNSCNNICNNNGNSNNENNHNNSCNILKSNVFGTCCDNSSLKHIQFYCNTCLMYLCEDCYNAEVTHPSHDQHNLEPFGTFLSVKKSNANKLLDEISEHKENLIYSSERLINIRENLTRNRDNLNTYITSRASELCAQIMRHRDKLMDQLTTQYNACMDEYKSKETLLTKNIEALDDCLNFSKEILQEKHNYNFLRVEDELMSHMNRKLTQQQNNKDNRLTIQQFKLEQPNEHKKDQLIEKLVGSLITGNVGSGISHSVAKYSADISWPCCLATNNKDIVVAGKTESSGGSGKLLFFNKDTKLLKYLSFHDNQLPVDMIPIDDKHFLLTTNSGEVNRFSFRGELVNKWGSIFEGPFGHMSANYNGTGTVSDVLITNINNELLLFDVQSGKIKSKITLRTKERAIRSITKHPVDDLIYVIFDDNIIQTFDTSGHLINPNLINSQANLKCPTSIICDSFGNLLISDFINDCISLFSRDGHILGLILDKSTDGVSCPNKIMLDPHYNLYIAQCGGDIAVYNYISILKKA